jgi:hypothetical protein
MTLWVGALALGLGLAGMALGVYLSFRVLAFPDLTVDGSFPLGVAVSAVLIVKVGWQPWLTLPVAFGAGVLAGCLPDCPAGDPPAHKRPARGHPRQPGAVDGQSAGHGRELEPTHAECGHSLNRSGRHSLRPLGRSG